MRPDLTTIELVSKKINFELFDKSAKQDLPELGEILLSLTYLPSAGRLNLDVLRAKQLLQTDIVGGAGCCRLDDYADGRF